MQRTLMIGLALLLAMVAASCRQSAGKQAATTAQQTFEGVIVAAGDSLTAGLGVAQEAGYPAQLQDRLAQHGLPYQVINSGVSGETSSGTLSRLQWILSLKPDIVILETGANDGLRGLDPALTRQNITKIVTELQGRNIITILAGMQMVGNLGLSYTDAFRHLYQEVARDTGVIFMPFFLEGVAAVPALNIDDGIHPNQQGYQIITGNLFPYVVQAIEQNRKRH